MSSKKVKLLVAPCSYEAAKHACLKYHYSKSVPAGKLVKFGVWEDNEFIGCVIFGRGGTLQIGQPYNLNQDEVCELVRVALKEHNTPVSKIISKSLQQLKQSNPLIKLIVSYADSNQNHLGIIYQATNWIYEGWREVTPSIVLNGKKYHARSVHAKYGFNGIQWLKKNVDSKAHYAEDKGRHKYLMPLTKATRRQIEPLSKPYPKAVLV